MTKSTKPSLIVQIVALLTLLAQGWVLHEQSIKLAQERFNEQRQKESELNLAGEYGDFILKVMAQCDCGDQP